MSTRGQGRGRPPFISPDLLEPCCDAAAALAAATERAEQAEAELRVALDELRDLHPHSDSPFARMRTERDQLRAEVERLKRIDAALDRGES